MSERKSVRESRFQLCGWLLFLACAIFFIVDNIITWSPWGFAGSVLFLLGCIAFIIPFTWKRD